ncbi:MAG: hypothetical protein JNK61_11570 [Bacteroidia bacterium]|nr:hypothetical protein [Bacteroidia bacterium]
MKRHLLKITHLFLLVFASFFPTNTNGQSLSISTEINERGFDYVKVMGQTENGFYVLFSNFPFASNRDKVGFKVRKYKAAFYDFDMKSKWSLPIETPDNYTLDNITFACQKLLITYSNESENNVRNYYLQWITEKGSIQANTNKNFELTFKKGSSVDKVEVSTSLNRNCLLFLLHEVTNDNHQIFHLATADSSLVFQHIKTLEIPYKPGIFAPQEFDVSNAGTIALSGILFKSEKRNKGKIFDGKHQYYTFLKESNTAALNEFFLADKQIVSSSMAFDNNTNELIIAGFYFESQATIGSGIAMQRLNPDSAYASPIVTQAFDPSKDDELKGARNSNDANDLFNYTIKKIGVTQNGGITVLAESFYTSEYSYFDYFTQSYYQRVEYHYGNVLVAALHADGRIAYSKLIKKQQNSVDDAALYSSYASMTQYDQLYIFYNKNTSNNNELMGVSINSQANRQQINFGKNLDNLYIMPNEAKQVSANELITPAFQKRRLVLAKIKL